MENVTNGGFVEVPKKMKNGSLSICGWLWLKGWRKQLRWVLFLVLRAGHSAGSNLLEAWFAETSS